MDDQIGHFLNFMSVEKGASDNTIAAYKNDLGQFDAFLVGINGRPRGWQEIQRDLLIDYLSTLKKRNYAEATVARKVATLKSFFGYLQAEGVIRRNPAETLESPRVERKLPKPLSVTQIDDLLEQPLKKNTAEARRDRAMLELAYATGLRASELAALNLEDLHLPPETTDRVASSDRPYLRCLGKRGMERTIPIHAEAAAALVIYLKEGRPPLVKARKENALFVNRRGERLTRQGFWLVLKLYAKSANINSPVTTQSIRHSFATHMLRGGMNLRHVQELMGHANISTTQIYQSLADDVVRQVYDKAHPRQKLTAAR
jgi:integrase/recombinase XerD